MKRQVVLFITGLAFLLVSSVPAFSFGLGDVGGFDLGRAFEIGKKVLKGAPDFNEEQRYYIGRAAGASILSANPLWEKKQLQAYVSAVGQTLALASDKPETFAGYHFIVLNKPESVNAYAVPGGFIFITTGLVLSCESEDELAGVLAHEVAHIVLDHPVGSIKKGYRDDILKDVASMALESTVSGQAKQLANLVGGLDKLSGMIIDSAAKGYSRQKESEADKEAINIMRSAGYDPRALASVLDKLSPVGSGTSGTHGKPEKRAKAVRKIAKEDDPQFVEARGKRFFKRSALK